MSTPIDLFIEALSTAAAQALSQENVRGLDCHRGRQAEAGSPPALSC